MFSHTVMNGPESKTMRMFCPVRLVAAPEALENIQAVNYVETTV